MTSDLSSATGRKAIEAGRIAQLEFHGYTAESSMGDDYRDETIAALNAALPVLMEQLVKVSEVVAALRGYAETLRWSSDESAQDALAAADFIERWARERPA